MVKHTRSGTCVREKPDTKVHVVPSQYALALQRRNQKRHAGSAAIHTVRPANQDPEGQIETSYRNEHRNYLRSAGLSSRKMTMKILGTSDLKAKPRPPFPTRIVTSAPTRIIQPVDFVGEYYEDVASGFEHSMCADNGGMSTKLNEQAEVKTTHVRIAEDQMLATWQALHFKLHHLQEKLLRFDRQQHATIIEDDLTHELALFQAADALPGVLGRISHLSTSLEIASHQLHGSDFSNTNSRQLQQHLEALNLELDQLFEHVETADVNDLIYSVVSFQHNMQRLSAKASTALLQVAQLLTELAVQVDGAKVLLPDS